MVAPHAAQCVSVKHHPHNPPTREEERAVVLSGGKEAANSLPCSKPVLLRRSWWEAGIPTSVKIWIECCAYLLWPEGLAGNLPLSPSQS